MQERRQLPYLKGRIAMPEAQAQPQPPIQQPSLPQPPQPPQPQPEQPRPIKEIKSEQNKAPESKKNNQRIDTEQIPRPIIRAEESSQYLQFSTQPVPLYHPPQTHSFFVTKDEGNVGPRLMRTSIYAIGNESSILNQTEIPFGVVVQPLQEPFPGEEDIPLVQFNHDPIRCNRCKAYVNPFFQFIDSGNSFICNICKAKNPVPMEYYSPLSQGNQRANKYMSPELHKGAYEIVAPGDYIKKKIENILILFCIEISQRTVSKGIYKQIITSIQSTLDSIPFPERTDIAFITFDSRIQFYNIPQNLNSEPQIIVVSELNEANVPLPLDKLFLNVQNDKEKIDYMLEKLEKYGVSNKPHSIAVGTVLTNAYNLIAPRTGRILYFGSQAPTSGIGKVTLRRIDQKLFGSDEEKTLYKPQNQEFIKLGEQCQRSHISTDLFIFSEDHFDLATVAPISNLTGGQIYLYPQFHPVVNGTELHYQIYRNLTRAYAYDGVMTLRTSEGIVLQSYITSSGIREVRDLELANINTDQSIGILLKQDEKIVGNESYLQYALLYTNQNGQRLIRVFNQQLQVVNKNNANNPWHNIFKTADMDAILMLSIRKFLPNILTHPLKQVRQQIFDALVAMLHSYRKYCSSNSPTGQLILPDAIKTLPLFIQALNKRDILKYGVVRIDNRIYEQHLLLYQTFNYVNNMLYPKLYQIHDCSQILIDEKYYVGQVGKENDIIIPNNLAISNEKIKSNGVYILDCSEYIFVYVCNDVSPAIIREIFGVQNMNDIVNIDEMPQLDTDLNQTVNNIIDALRRYSGGAYQPVKIIKQNSTSSSQFTCKLFEDDWQTEKSYGEYLCEIHAAILAKGI